MSEALRLEFADQIATLTIDRPAKRNAISYQMWSEFPEIAAEVDKSDAAVLVVRGGEHFSAGADISEFQTLRAGAEGAARYSEAVHSGERALSGISVPTIAAISGFCIGGGCEIALACDIRLSADNATFGITPAKLGIVYHFTSTQQLVNAVGPAWAKQILFSAEFLDAATALRIGLVNEVHPVSELDGRVAALAATIRDRAMVSVTGAKTIVNAIQDGSGDGPEIDELYAKAHASAEYAEGVSAFLEKRKPDFARARK